MLSVSDSKPLSVTCAVMVWVPTDKLDVLTDAPAPIALSMLELHCICVSSEPSSTSDAEPWNVTESPSVNSEPDDGDKTDTVGGLFVVDWVIVTVMVSVSDSEPLSVTVAVMVWVPNDRFLVKDAPVPIDPSILEVHCSEEFKELSSTSEALPWNVTEVMSTNSVPSGGDVIDTVGAVFGPPSGITVNVIWSLDWLLFESVTAAVIVCEPPDKFKVPNDEPVARNPSMLELHCICVPSEPSSLSDAEPKKLIQAPSFTSRPVPGDMIETVGKPGGATSFIVMEVVVVVVRPPESVTDAVTIWIPTDKLDVLTDAPVPIALSMSELHWICELTTPSCRSFDVPEKTIVSPSSNELPNGGESIVNVGGLFGGKLSGSSTITRIVTELERPIASSTSAVIAWEPMDNELVVKELPRWIVPSILELQKISLLRSPCSASSAKPTNVIGTPSRKSDPDSGEDIPIVGLVLLAASKTVMKRVSVSLRPPESVTWTVIIWSPADNVVENLFPVKRSPSIFEDHSIKSRIFPSSGSWAPAQNSIECILS